MAHSRLSMMTLRLERSLATWAKPMRQEFERLLSRPEEARTERYVWDPFCLPGHYAHLRSPLTRVFSHKLCEAFCSSLLERAVDGYGCSSMTPPWVSLYLEGHYQRVHRDSPHGPLAYVYSLNPRSIAFQGGQSVVYSGNKTAFKKRLEMGELLVFDASTPHEVLRVSKTVDPLKGRLVVHGWFSDPQPLAWNARGSVAADFSEVYDDPVVDRVGQKLRGFVSFGWQARTKQVELLCSTLKGRSAQVAEAKLSERLKRFCSERLRPGTSARIPFWWPDYKPL
jgi:hypothetical protein